MMRRSQMKKGLLINCRGLSLIEVLASGMILAASFALFYNVFVINWTALEGYIARNQLWQEAATIIRQMSDDGRHAKVIEIVEDTASRKAVRFMDKASVRIALYEILPNGELHRTDIAGNRTLMSDHLLFGSASFQKDGQALEIALSLETGVLTKTVQIDTVNEVFPRNYLY